MLNDSISTQELCSSNAIFQLGESPRRSLGCAILVAAIEDYQSLDEQIHFSAMRFLFPRTRAYREHYDWAIGLAKGIHPDWLRCSLDRAKLRWDKSRTERKLRAHLLRQLEQRRAHGWQEHEESVLSLADGDSGFSRWMLPAAHSDASGKGSSGYR